MLGIVGAFAIITTLGLSLVVARVAAKALILTGLDEGVAHFQARSAMTGTGFTTEESESVVNHPIRRRILWNHNCRVAKGRQSRSRGPSLARLPSPRRDDSVASRASPRRRPWCRQEKRP